MYNNTYDQFTTEERLSITHGLILYITILYTARWSYETLIL